MKSSVSNAKALPLGTVTSIFGIFCVLISVLNSHFLCVGERRRQRRRRWRRGWRRSVWVRWRTRIQVGEAPSAKEVADLAPRPEIAMNQKRTQPSYYKKSTHSIQNSQRWVHTRPCFRKWETSRARIKSNMDPAEPIGAPRVCVPPPRV